MHNKAASGLCKNEDTILSVGYCNLGRWPTSPGNKSDRRRTIGSKTQGSRTVLGWRHLELRNVLASNVLMHGKELGVVMEELKTRCCGQSRNLNKKPGGARGLQVRQVRSQGPIFKCDGDDIRPLGRASSGNACKGSFLDDVAVVLSLAG